MLDEVRLPILRNGSEILVTLMLGGDRFPWANIGGKVFIGPPAGETVYGMPSWFLKWTKSLYWVFEAEDVWGDMVELTPNEYESAVTSAENFAIKCIQKLAE